MSVTLGMKSGFQFALAGYASRVQEVVNEGRGTGKLIGLERDRIPTGQMVYIDPDDVEFVKDDR
jgi:hypothetical protein